MQNNPYNFDSSSRFLVTGGAGFIGSNLCEALLHMGHEVVALDDLSTGKKENVAQFIQDNNFTFIEGDIRDFEVCSKACNNIDYVLHQAAWGSVPKSLKYPLLYEQINIQGTLNMLEAARQNNVKRFVYASSSSVYGDSKQLPKKEGEEGNVLSPYALTKKVNEEYAKQYSMHYGLETIGLRYFNVFGKRQDPNGAYAAVIPKFIKQILNEEQPVIYGDGEQSRDFTYIENVIDANLKACAAPSDSTGQAYNIAYGGQDTLNNVFKILKTNLGSQINPSYDKPRPGDIKHSNADISNAKKHLNYNPQWSFENGIKQAIDWYFNNA